MHCMVPRSNWQQSSGNATEKGVERMEEPECNEVCHETSSLRNSCINKTWTVAQKTIWVVATSSRHPSLSSQRYAENRSTTESCKAGRGIILMRNQQNVWAPVVFPCLKFDHSAYSWSLKGLIPNWSRSYRAGAHVLASPWPWDASGHRVVSKELSSVCLFAFNAQQGNRNPVSVSH